MKYTYETFFQLTNPVNDFYDAREFLSEDDMTVYLKHAINTDAKCDIDPNSIAHIEWVLKDADWGLVQLETTTELTPDQLKWLTKWTKGQCSDGIGEGFEQQSFAEVYDDADVEDDDWGDHVIATASFDYTHDKYQYKLKNKTNESLIDHIVDSGSTICISEVVNKILEDKMPVRQIIELAIVRDTYTELKGLAKKNYQRCPEGKWNSTEPVSIDVYDQPLRVAFTFFNANDAQAEDWIRSFCDKQNIIITNLTKTNEKPIHLDLRVSDFSAKTKPLDGVNSTYTVVCGMEQPKKEVASKIIESKPNYRVTFHDGPTGNKSYNIDVDAKDSDEAFKKAYKQFKDKFGDEPYYKGYTDASTMEIPVGPSRIGIEFMYTDTAYGNRKGTQYMSIIANDEADAVDIYNKTYRGKTFWQPKPDKIDPDGKCVYGDVKQTYFT